jgi:hypothetical protein
MKIKLFLLALLAFGSYSVNAQNKLCSEIYAANLFNVYVFSEQTGHDLTTLMGEQINPALVNIIYVKTAEQKAEVDKNCKMGKMEGSVLIFLMPTHPKPEDFVPLPIMYWQFVRKAI